MTDLHEYLVRVTWTGNLGSGTSGYKHYSRDFALEANGKPAIAGTADTVFHGSPGRWNPEEMLVAALSSCHQLSYLHLCAVNGVIVTAYAGEAEGFMRFDSATGSGRFERVVLRPEVTITADSDVAKARELHHQAHELCFIANSVNFAVECEPVIERAQAGAEMVAGGR
ncbi:MAG TPA: OsmC family protein [Acidobacteriaceae bacterium]|nr:OsmC family protein [Acidobacteriaceae bacterium]